MRRVAMAAGISIKLTTIDDPNPQQNKYLSNTGRALAPRLKVIAWQCQRRQSYGDARSSLPKIDWCLQRVSTDKMKAGKSLTDEWDWSKMSNQAISDRLGTWLETAIKQLPKDVEQVEETRCLVSVYWHEREAGTEKQVIDFLKGCTELSPHESIQ